MVIGILKLELHIPASNSLKHKRMILNSLKGRLKSRFNISIAEISGHDKWQRAVIAICQVGPDKIYINRAMDKVLRFVESFNGADLLNSETEMI